MNKCPTCKRNLHKSRGRVDHGKRLIEWRKANGRLNMGRPAKIDWKQALIEMRRFPNVKHAADHYKVNAKTIYQRIRAAGLKTKEVFGE